MIRSMSLLGKILWLIFRGRRSYNQTDFETIRRYLPFDVQYWT